MPQHQITQLCAAREKQRAGKQPSHVGFMDLFAKFPGVTNDDAWTQGVNWFQTRENFKRASVTPATGGNRGYS